MYQEMRDACYYGQMKDYNYEKLVMNDIVWTNYEYHELLNY